MGQQDAALDQFVRNNELYLNQLLNSRKGRLVFALSPKLRRLHAECDAACTPECKNTALARLLGAFIRFSRWPRGRPLRPRNRFEEGKSPAMPGWNGGVGAH